MLCCSHGDTYISSVVGFINDEFFKKSFKSCFARLAASGSFSSFGDSMTEIKLFEIGVGLKYEMLLFFEWLDALYKPVRFLDKAYVLKVCLCTFLVVTGSYLKGCVPYYC
jgi:hypothetical protein